MNRVVNTYARKAMRNNVTALIIPVVVLVTHSTLQADLPETGRHAPSQ